MQLGVGGNPRASIRACWVKFAVKHLPIATPPGTSSVAPVLRPDLQHILIGVSTKRERKVAKVGTNIVVVSTSLHSRDAIHSLTLPRDLELIAQHNSHRKVGRYVF